MRRQVALGLLLSGIALLVVGLLLWSKASDEREQHRLAARYERAILLDQGDDELADTVDLDPDAERTVPIAVLVVGLLAVVGAVAVRVSEHD